MSTRLMRPLLLGLTLLLLSACTPGATTAADAEAARTAAGVRVVDPVTARDLLAEEPERVIIDVRTPGEFTQGHLQRAELVDYEAPGFADRIAEYDRDAAYLIYCRSGNRSAGARAVMAELGFQDVVDVEGGIVAWTDAGLPVTAA